MNGIHLLYFCILFGPPYLQSQNFDLDSVVVLQNNLRESSGLLYHDGVFITHNDSGDGPYLYEIDTLTGSIARTVYLANASAIDWEDLAADDTYLYIGDFGNNFGGRTDLAIYRLRWDDYRQSDTVLTDKISFGYAEQTDFSLQIGTTPFDAESLIATTDGLYLFTKNWSDYAQSKVYRIPKTPGEYTLTAIDSIVTPGLLTGVDYLPSDQTLIFTAYDFDHAFVLELSTVDFGDFSEASSRSWILPLEGSFKTEAIAYANDRYAYLTKERNSLGEAVLYRLDTDFSTSIAVPARAGSINVFPNPTKDGLLNFQLKAPAGSLVNSKTVLHLFDRQGRIVYRSTGLLLDIGRNSWQVDISALPRGGYFYELRDHRLLASGRLVVE